MRLGGVMRANGPRPDAIRACDLDPDRRCVLGQEAGARSAGELRSREAPVDHRVVAAGNVQLHYVRAERASPTCGLTPVLHVLSRACVLVAAHRLATRQLVY